MAEGMTEPNDYLIWSDEHGAWWRANSCGYTESILYAGRYTESEAREICEGANLHGRNERMVKWGPELADLATDEAVRAVEVEARVLRGTLRNLRYHLKGRYDTELVKMINDVVPPDEDDTTGGASNE